jgi:hypothetical protein
LVLGVDSRLRAPLGGGRVADPHSQKTQRQQDQRRKAGDQLNPLNPFLLDPVVPFRQLGPKLTLIGQVYLPGSKKISLSVKPLTVRADDTYSRGAGLLRVLITPVGRSVLLEPGDYIQRRGEASAAA